MIEHTLPTSIGEAKSGLPILSLEALTLMQCPEVGFVNYQMLETFNSVLYLEKFYSQKW